MSDPKQEKPRIWSANQREFIRWLALPSEYRGEVRKEYQFAEKIKVNPSTLWDWKRLPGFWDEVTIASKQYLADTVPEGLRTFKEQVRRGSFKHQRMYFEMVGLYTPKSETTVKGEIKQHITEYEYTDDDSSDTEPQPEPANEE